MKKRGNLYHIMLAMSIVVGIVIGTGIFFQNENIIAWSQGNTLIVLLSWIIGAIIALTITLSYVEIARNSKRSNTGVGQFAEEVISKKMGWHTKLAWPNYYYAFFTFAVSTFVSNFMVNLVLKSRGFNPGSDHTIIIFTIGVIIFIAFFAINSFLPKIGEMTQINLAIIKFVPILILVVGGIITLFFISKYTSWWSTSLKPPLPPDHIATSDFGKAGMVIFILPAVLFSFDGSIAVTDLTEDIRNRRHITIALIGGMSIITITYLLVTIAILNTGTLNGEDAIIKMLGGDPKKLTIIFNVIGAIIQAFIIVAALGVVNGVTIAWTRGIKAIIKKPTKLKVFFCGLTSTTLSFIIPIVGISLFVNYTGYGGQKAMNIGLLNMLVMNTTILAYSIYAIMISFALFKYRKTKNNSHNSDKYHTYKKWFPYTTIIAVIGISTVVLYQFGYVLIYRTIVDPQAMIGGIYSWLYMIIALLYIVWYCVLPFVIKKLFKNVFVKDLSKT